MTEFLTSWHARKTKYFGKNFDETLNNAYFAFKLVNITSHTESLKTPWKSTFRRFFQIFIDSLWLEFLTNLNSSFHKLFSTKFYFTWIPWPSKISVIKCIKSTLDLYSALFFLFFLKVLFCIACTCRLRNDLSE